jgi:hypothetical protein
VLKLCAAWLVLLIVLPFSAPFSTCDLGMLTGQPGQQHDVAGDMKEDASDSTPARGVSLHAADVRPELRPEPGPHAGVSTAAAMVRRSPGQHHVLTPGTDLHHTVPLRI